MSEEYPDRIAETLSNKTILITGVTGFIGKILLEKILRCCSQVQKIYVLVRRKYNKDPNTRMKEIFNKPVFDLLKKEKGLTIFDKVEAIHGDLIEPELGLSIFDRIKLCEQVEIIYHVASTVRFDSPLKESTLLNVRGTKLMINLAKQCKHLQLFMYVSTAFCHVNEKVTEEKTYHPPTNPDQIITICESLDNKTVEKIKTRLMSDHPNTYSFTKALSEGLVNEVMSDIPCVILRPSVVTPILFEPLPGYVDNLSGPTGLVIAGGKGILRTMCGSPDGFLDYIPVDIVVNAILAATLDFISNRGIRRVYNVTTNQNSYTLKKIIEIGCEIVTTKYPFNSMVWYPEVLVTTNKFLHYLMIIFFQLLPALFIDGILFISGQKPFLIKVQKKMLYSTSLFEYYVNRNWNFNNEESLKAINFLNPLEKRRYVLKFDNFNLSDYFAVCMHAARLYLLNESEERLPSAKRLVKIMWMANLTVKFLSLLFGVYLLVNIGFSAFYHNYLKLTLN